MFENLFRPNRNKPEKNNFDLTKQTIDSGENRVTRFPNGSIYWGSGCNYVAPQSVGRERNYPQDLADFYFPFGRK